MKNKVFKFALLLLFSSCAATYVPNVVNTPMLEQKGEFQAAVNVGLSGFDPQLSYAMTDNIGLMLNASFANRTSDYTTEDYYKHNYYELGVGYYTKLNDKLNFETFVGGGFGNVQSLNDYIIGKNIIDANQTRFFIQPTFGRTSKHFDIGFSTRIVMVNTSVNTSDNTLTNPLGNDSDNTLGNTLLNTLGNTSGNTSNRLISTDNTKFYFEPVGTIKVGFEHLKFVTQIGFSIPTVNLNADSNPFLFSLGLQYQFGKHK